jgi:RNA polymerase sigma-70 factor (ECF subfamily)
MPDWAVRASGLLSPAAKTGKVCTIETMRSLDWELVYQEEMPRVYNYFLYRAGERQTAEDLTALTFERAWSLRNRYRKGQGEVRAWLFGFAKNIFREYLRGHYKELEQSRKLIAVRKLEESAQQSEQAEKERLFCLLSRLPQREQNLIALKYGGGLTNREIARLCLLSESNVGSILHRCTQKLRGEWEVSDER